MKIEEKNKDTTKKIDEYDDKNYMDAGYTYPSYTSSDGNY